MFTTNPFSQLTPLISAETMQIFIIVMVLLVIGGTIFDVIHKKSGQYFFANLRRPKDARPIGGGEKAVIAAKVLASEVLTSSEFCNPKRRIAHLLTMYGFCAFAVATVVLVFCETTAVIWPLLWHFGALALAGGGYWFWFFIRVDVAAEGLSPFRLMRADLFVLSLLAMSSFALLWSAVGGLLLFGLFITATVVLFAGVPWSKFAHMFFKPAAAYEKQLSVADGSMNNLPPPADAPKQFGLGIKRDAPKNY